MRMIKILHPPFLTANIEHKEVFYISEGYLFKKLKLCIPQGTYRRLLIKESHEGGLMGHFGVDKL